MAPDMTVNSTLPTRRSSTPVDKQSCGPWRRAPARVLVGAESCLVVPAGLGQLLSQDIGADHGDAGAAANGRARGVAGVADQSDPTLDPAIHHDLADRIEVEVLSGVHFGQQPGKLPPIASIDLVQ